jgi:hypothetical protein
MSLNPPGAYVALGHLSSGYASGLPPTLDSEILTLYWLQSPAPAPGPLGQWTLKRAFKPLF